MQEIVSRGFSYGNRKLLVCIDGSKALRKAVDSVFGKGHVMVQRCYLHKLRNLCGYVPKEYHAQLRRRMKKMMGLVDYTAALHVLEELTSWLAEISIEAKNSVEEAGKELLTVHRLGMPEKIRKTFSTTNPIESVMSIARSNRAA